MRVPRVRNAGAARSWSTARERVMDYGGIDDIPRHDPFLVQVVEKLRQRANGDARTRPVPYGDARTRPGPYGELTSSAAELGG